VIFLVCGLFRLSSFVCVCLSRVRSFACPLGGLFVCLFVCSDEGERKYGATVDRVGGCFRAAVMERFGAVGDDMQAMVRGACGDLDRDRGEEDWALSAPSQVTYYMQHIVLAGVMADAAMSVCLVCVRLRALWAVCLFVCLH
jgi:hypothetical protein